MEELADTQPWPPLIAIKKEELRAPPRVESEPSENVAMTDDVKSESPPPDPLGCHEAHEPKPQQRLQVIGFRNQRPVVTTCLQCETDTTDPIWEHTLKSTRSN